MTLGSIQFGGLASGLDTGAIIEAILRLERRPIDVLESRKENEQEKLTLIGTFEGLVKALQQKAKDLRLASNFFAHALTEGKEGVADFTLSAGAASGTHTLQVTSLAQADRYSWAGVADPDTSLGAGTISFTVGGQAYSVSVASGSDTLHGIAAAINAEALPGVTTPVASDVASASVVNVGTEAAPSWQLVIAGKETGADFAITGLSSSIAGLTGQTQLTIASNATVVIDGLTVQRSSNVFADVLPGVAFTVAAVDTTTFTVDLDIEGMKTNIQGFVDAYNEVVKFINDQSRYSEEGGASGELFGDSALASVRGALRTALFDVDLSFVQADTEGYSTLGLIGIELQNDGTLKIDAEKLDQKLSGNLDLFSEFFRHEAASETESDGILVKLDTALENLIRPGTSPSGQALAGLFANRRDAINELIRGIDDDIDRRELHVEKLEESLILRFSALENLMSGLNAQAAFLSSGFPQVGGR